MRDETNRSPYYEYYAKVKLNKTALVKNDLREVARILRRCAAGLIDMGGQSHQQAIADILRSSPPGSVGFSIEIELSKFGNECSIIFTPSILD